MLGADCQYSCLKGVQTMEVEAYIHSLKDHKNNRHVLGKAKIIKKSLIIFTLRSIMAFYAQQFSTLLWGDISLTMCMGFRRRRFHADFSR